MAKTFYTLSEAAHKLNMSPEQVKDLAASNKIQQYKASGDQFMYKVEQVDALAGGGGSKDDSGPIALADSGANDAIKLSEESTAGKTDAINLAEATDVADSPASDKSSAGKTGAGKTDDPRQATGVSVFDADEVEHVDPMAQTQVTNPSSTADEELALESVGSGSGLLDLTRESDDTSLGAELLDEIYPGGAEGSGAGKTDGGGSPSGATVTGAPPGSSGVFDGAIQMESGPSGLENISQSSDMMPMMASQAVEEETDPLWSGITAGAFAGTCITLLVGISIAVAGLMGIKGPIVGATGSSMGGLMGLCVVLLIVVVAFAGVGAVLGMKMAPRRSSL